MATSHGRPARGERVDRPGLERGGEVELAAVAGERAERAEAHRLVARQPEVAVETHRLEVALAGRVRFLDRAEQVAEVDERVPEEFGVARPRAGRRRVVP